MAERKHFPAEMIISYLEELLEMDPVNPNEMENTLRRNANIFFEENKDEWDLKQCLPEHILEVIILEALLHSRNDSLDLNSIMDEYYYPHFSNAFFDPDPNPRLSITGWLNYNFGQQYEETEGTLPMVSLHPAVEIIKALVEASPTCDELLTDNIMDRYLEHSETGDEEARLIFFYGEGADLIYQLSKVITEIKPNLRILHESFEDELPNDLGGLILSDLCDDFLETFDGDNNEDAIRYHPLSLVKNLLEDLEEELT